MNFDKDVAYARRNENYLHAGRSSFYSTLTSPFSTTLAINFIFNLDLYQSGHDLFISIGNIQVS